MMNSKSSKSKCRIVFLLMLCAILFMGCSDSARNPTDTGTPGGDNNGDNGGGNDDDTVDYGILYFTSESSTQWQADGPVTVTNGNITAYNQSNLVQNGRCILVDSIDFQSSTHITFTWREDVENGASYSFLASDSPERLQIILYREDANGYMAGQFELFMSSPIFVCYLFTMPPSGSVTLSSIRGYGK